MRLPAILLRHVNSIQHHIAEALLLQIATILKFVDGKQQAAIRLLKSKVAEGASDRIIANLALLFSSTACVTYVRSTKIGDTALMTSWTCGATAAEYFVLATMTGGDSTSALSSSATEAAIGSSSPSSATESTSTSTSTSSSASKPTSTSAGDASTSISTSRSPPISSVTGTGTTSNETANPSPTSTHHILTPGEIAGISIGSIAGALIICAVFYFIFKNYTFVRRSPDDRRITTGYANGGLPKPISNSGFEMSDRMPGGNGNGTEFHDDRTWDGPAVDVTSLTSTA
ncbi:Hypothetical protein PENO1_061440 [Penicillium occitanis (nom. inval.)]|nr:Hypothetical protein PENO1_061440 [Penicillium occitanis (nom. inval.)]PCH08215.1 hypothetical protein PENOC_015840 [Penicillium occitanis (nom. inval.)]